MARYPFVGVEPVRGMSTEGWPPRRTAFEGISLLAIHTDEGRDAVDPDLHQWNAPGFRARTLKAEY